MGSHGRVLAAVSLAEPRLHGMGLLVGPSDSGVFTRSPWIFEVKCVGLGDPRLAAAALRAADAHAMAAHALGLARFHAGRAMRRALGDKRRRAAASEAAWHCVGTMSLALAARGAIQCMAAGTGEEVREAFLWRGAQAAGTQGAMLLGSLLDRLDGSGHAPAAKAARECVERSSSQVCGFVVEFARARAESQAIAKSASRGAAHRGPRRI